MTLEELIAEGRKLERPCLFLRPQGEGPVVAVWHERDRDEIARTGHRALLTVDTRHVPGLSAPTAGYLTIFTDHKRCEGGRIEQSASWPKRKGTPLYAHAASVLPPSDALFARGSQAVAQWHPDAAVVQKYEDAWMREFPLLFQRRDLRRAGRLAHGLARGRLARLDRRPIDGLHPPRFRALGGNLAHEVRRVSRHSENYLTRSRA